jgi:hypothetical protein
VQQRTRSRLAVVAVAAAAIGCTGSSGAGNQVHADASPVDAGAGGASGQPDGSCAGAIVCEDFEEAGVGHAPSGWLATMNGGTIAVDTTRAWSGAQSVMFSAAAASGYRSALLGWTRSLPTSSSIVFGRMMFWLDSAPTDSVHWTFVDGYGVVPDGGYHAVYRYGGQLPVTADDGGFAGSQMMASYDTPDSYNATPSGPASDCYEHGGRVVPVQTWTCVEWEFDGTSDTMRMWLDGAEATDLAVVGTGDGCTQQPDGFEWTAPRFQRIDVGWESYQADDARTIWIDDVALSTARIGCPSH